MNKLQRFGLTFGVLITAGIAPAFAGPTLDRIKATGVVNIGFREVGIPFSYKSSDGPVPLGYSVEICTAIVEEIKATLKLKTLETKYTTVTGATRIPSIIEGKTDLECANTTNTKARRDQVSFSMAHYFAAAKLLVRDGSGITKLDDMAGKTLAVSKGSTGLLIAEARKKERLPTMKIVVVETSNDGAKAVETKSVDGFITDDILLHGFKAQSKVPLAVVGAGMSIEPLAIMFAKNDPELETIVNREMSRLYTTGKLRQIYRKWFQTELPQRGYNLNVSPNALTSEMFSRPSAYTVDWVVL
jgi:glutamate/aspartate transport system substrate-binding protein